MSVRHRIQTLCLGLVLVAAIVGAQIAVAQERVTFESKNLSLPSRPGETISAYLLRPAGDGSFPAAVLLHGCAGINESPELDWARKIADWGYVTLVIDSLGPRGIESACRSATAPRSQDAWSGVDYLKTLPFVDPERIAFVGWSQGASTALWVAAKAGFPAAHRDSIKAVIALYPNCRTTAELLPPVLVLVGDRDDWTGWTPCVDLEATQSRLGHSFELVVYEGATHSFDCIHCDGIYHGHPLHFNRSAYLDALTRAKAFLAKYLGQ